MSFPALPLWFRLVVAFDLLLAILIGGAGTFVISAMLPYGHPQPDALTVLAKYGLAFIIAPVLVVLACGIAGAWLLRFRLSLPALLVIAAPAAMAPWLFVRSLA